MSGVSTGSTGTSTFELSAVGSSTLSYLASVGLKNVGKKVF